MAGFIRRMVRAARLDASLYEEVEADKSAMGQAIVVVLISGIAAGIGTYSLGGVSGLFSGALGGIIGWFIWAYLTYFIGTRFFAEPQTEATSGQLLRTIGFSSAPGIIRVLGIIPGLYTASFAIASVWMLATMVVAVRQALDYRGIWRAIGVVLIGWILYIIIFVIIGLFFFRAASSPVEYTI